jgi:V/A-type H+-transporting ATPase subunit E
MGAIENITERIKKDASAKANVQINHAKAEADEIINQAKIELEKEKKALEMDTEKSIKIQKNRAVSEAKLEARKMNLAAKEEVITSAFSLAQERLKTLGAQETEGYLRRAVKNAVSLLGSEVTVLCNSKDSQMVSKIASEINPGITVSSTGIDILGGAVIRTKDNKAQIDATFEGVLDRIRSDLRREVAQILFGNMKKED